MPCSTSSTERLSPVVLLLAYSISCSCAKRSLRSGAAGSIALLPLNPGVALVIEVGHLVALAVHQVVVRFVVQRLGTAER